jgi:hypothetical protein
MRLSAEQFAELVAMLQDRRGKAYPGEKRRSARVSVQARISIELISAEQRQPSYSVNVRDISSRGIAILHPTPLLSGQQFVCSLSRHRGGSLQLLCTVTNSRRLPGGEYHVGAEFTCTVGGASRADQSAIEARIRNSVLD